MGKEKERQDTFVHNDELYVKLGSCRKPHGIKGGFNLFLYNHEDSVLKKGMEVVLLPESAQSSLKDDYSAYKISSLKVGAKSILYFNGITDRNLSEEMLPFAVYCKRSDFPEADEGEIYLQDLIGFDAFDKATGELLGKVDSYSFNGVQDIINIGDLEIIFIDNFVDEVNLEEKKIIINKPEYL